jgi:hypothetical protein
MRLQERGRIIRSLYLCDWCLESLLAIYINDLFEIAKIAVIAFKAAEFKVKLEIYLTIANRLDSL